MSEQELYAPWVTCTCGHRCMESETDWGGCMKCGEVVPDEQFTLRRELVNLIVPGSTVVDCADGLRYHQIEWDGWNIFFDPDEMLWYYEPEPKVEFMGPFTTCRDTVQAIIDYEIEMAWYEFDDE